MAEYYGITPHIVSYIKKEKIHANIPMMILKDIGTIIGIFFISEEEKRYSMVMLIICL